MEITSLYFGLLSIVSVFIYYLLKHKYRVFFLTLLSVAFIATYSYNLLIYVLLYSLINYYLGIKIHDSKSKIILFRTALFINLTQLIVLKYASFTINPFFQLINVDYDISVFAKFIVPVGISFFTLQAIGYLINIKNNWEKPEKNFVHFLLYIIFFPKFLSGPVERSNQFLPQLKINKTFSEDNVTEGLKMVLFGVFKKIAIANQLAPVVISAYSNLDSAEGASLWIVLLIQPLYLYFDFSGYTDIAIGFAKAFGIKLRPNFNSPFLSENITTFWKRFHMSLSSWFTDYIFMRTSFKYRRWGKNAANFALFVTWILFGIWHGAGWNFMLLGLLQGIAIFYEFSTKRWRIPLFSKMPDFFRIWMGRIITYLFYGCSLVFFFSPDLNSVFLFFSKLFEGAGFLPGGIRIEIFLIVIVFMTVFILIEIIQNDFKNTFNKLESGWTSKKKSFQLVRWLIYIGIITIVIVFNNDVQQFIYFKF